MSEYRPSVTAVTDTKNINLPDGSEEHAFLVMIYGEFLGRRFIIKNESLVIGRSEECDIRLVDNCVSRTHCRLTVSSDGYVVQDLDSTNGTYVNDTAVSARPLRDADRVKIGRSIFKFLTGDNVERAYHEEIYRLKTTDGLTGAYNRRYFDEELDRELYRYLRYERPLSLLMMDIDFFKKINDEFGHLAGDRVLSQLGLLVSADIRREDTFCRYGGEEFAVLMPEMEMTEAIEVAERLRKLVAGAHFDFEGLDFSVTISIGVAEADKSMKSPEDFVRVADKQLYRAKNHGRNRVDPTPKSGN